MSEYTRPNETHEAAEVILSAAELAEKQRRLIDDYNAAAVARTKSEVEDTMHTVKAAAEKWIAILESLPCKGNTAQVSACDAAIEAACEYRQENSCPKRIAAFDQARATQALEERFAASGVPGKVSAHAIAAKPTQATALIDTWLASESLLLVLAGGVGVGKSVAAAYAIRRTPGRWIHAAEIPKLTGHENEHKLRGLRHARLLVVDDLGAEYSDKGGWVRAAIEDLILQRYDDGLRTLCTTNVYVPAEFKAKYTERLIDRIREADGYCVVGGVSMRGAK